MSVPTLLHVFPTLSVGGQQTRFATLANRFGARYRHVLVSLDGRDDARRLLGAEVEYEMRSVAGGPAVQRFRAIGGLIGAVRPDALVTYNWGSIEWAMANRVRFRLPHVHLEDGFGRDEADRQKRRRVLARRWALRRALVVVPSRKLEALAVGQWRLAPARVRYVANGIDAGRFDGGRFDAGPVAASIFERGAAGCVVGAFSPLRAEKNLSRLLRAFAALPEDALLVVCGDGPEAGRLRALAEELRIAERVVFAGHVAAPELAIGAFDIFAITSDTEQMPYAVLEAMCARLPVASTDVGDIAAMLDPSNRDFVVARDDPAALVAALRGLAGDAARRREIGARNRAKVERDYTISQMADGFEAVLREALDGKKKHRGKN